MNFDFWNHWGAHAIDAMRTIHYVLGKTENINKKVDNIIYDNHTFIEYATGTICFSHKQAVQFSLIINFYKQIAPLRHIVIRLTSGNHLT